MKDSIERIIETYIQTAKQYGDWIDKGEFEKASLALESNQEIVRNIFDLGDRGRNALARLLNHNDPKVQIITASNLIDSDPIQSITILNKFKNNSGFNGFYSNLTLSDYIG